MTVLVQWCDAITAMADERAFETAEQAEAFAADLREAEAFHVVVVIEHPPTA